MRKTFKRVISLSLCLAMLAVLFVPVCAVGDVLNVHDHCCAEHEMMIPAALAPVEWLPGGDGGMGIMAVAGCTHSSYSVVDSGYVYGNFPCPLIPNMCVAYGKMYYEQRSCNSCNYFWVAPGVNYVESHSYNGVPH